MPSKALTKTVVEERTLSKGVLRNQAIKRLNNLAQALRDVMLSPEPVRQLKAIADFAAAQELWAARQKLGTDVENHGYAIKTEALATLGRLMQDMPKAPGTRGAGRPPKLGGIAADPPNSPPTLEELGVDKRTANVARKLAALEPAELNAVVARAKTLASVTREKVAEVRATRLALPDAKYRVIYADPPWKYRDKADAGGVQKGGAGGGGAARHYPSMSIEELCELDVKSITDQDCVLFLWVTSPLLFECAPVIQAWGFSYRSSIVWDKGVRNMGHYVGVQHEFLLICVRGSATPDSTERLPSVVAHERGKHSEKPEAFRAMIDSMYTVGKRIELFARTAVDGWDRYGNEGV